MKTFFGHPSTRFIINLALIPFASLLAVAFILSVLDQNISRSLFLTLSIVALFLPVIALAHGIVTVTKWGIVASSTAASAFWILVANVVARGTAIDPETLPSVTDNASTFAIFTVVASIALWVRNVLVKKSHVRKHV